MARCISAWALTVAATFAGTLAGHAVSYRLAYSDAHARSEALAGAGHGYLAYAPVIVTTCVAAALAACLLTIAVTRTAPATRLPALWFALPPLVFVVVEHGERLVHTGTLPLGLVYEPAFLFGLLVQVPFGVATGLAVRALLAVAAAMAAALQRGRPRIVSAIATAAFAVRDDDLHRIPAIARGYAGRAPPALL